jgi:hypothetical protein
VLRKETEGLVSDTIDVGYDYWNSCKLITVFIDMVLIVLADILNAILPPNSDSDLAPSSFTSTGHIGAYFNTQGLELLPQVDRKGLTTARSCESTRRMVAIQAHYRSSLPRCRYSRYCVPLS